MKLTDNSFENSITVDEVLLAHKCTYRSGECCNVYNSGRNFSGFVCPLSGQAIYRPFCAESFTVEPGEIVYLPAMSRYTVEGGEKGFTHYTVNFLISCGERDRKSRFDVLFGDKPVKISAENFDTFRNTFTKRCRLLVLMFLVQQQLEHMDQLL